MVKLQAIFYLLIVSISPLVAMQPEPEPRIIKLVSSIEPENQRVPVYIDSRLLPFASITRMREMQTGTYELAFPTPALRILQEILTLNHSLRFLPIIDKFRITRDFLNSPGTDMLIAQNALQILIETRELFYYLQLVDNQKIFIPAINEKIQTVAYKMWKETGQEIEIPGLWPTSFSITQLLDRNLIKPEDVCIRDNNGNLIELNLKNCRISSLEGIVRLFKLSDFNTCRKIDLSENQLASLEIGFAYNSFSALQILNLNNNRLSHFRTGIQPQGIDLPHNLLELHAEHNELIEGPRFLSLPLRVLNLSHNKLPAVPGNWVASNLEVCDLSHNNIREFVPYAYPVFGSPIPGTIHFLSEAPRLKQLNLSHNKLSTLPILFLTRSFELENINLSNNSLAELPIFVSLQRQPTDPAYGPDYQDKLKFLKTFDASNCYLMTLPNPFLPEAPNLEQLFLYNNQLVALPDSFCARSVGIRLIVLENNPFRVLQGTQTAFPQLDLGHLAQPIAQAIVRGKEYYEQEILPSLQARIQTGQAEHIARLGFGKYNQSIANKTDLSDAKKMLEAALKLPLSDATQAQVLNTLGRIAVRQNDCAKALEYLKKSSEQTADTDAQVNSLFNLGKLYLKGICVEQDYLRAKTLFEQAITANPNFHSAFEALGTIYYEGLGVPKNLPQAKQYFEQAMQFGSKVAQAMVRKIEEEEFKTAGIGTEKNEGPEGKKQKPNE